MKILVCGGRDFTDYFLMSNVLKQHVHEGDVLIHGAANGADILSEYVVTRYLSITPRFERYPADWKTYGKRAGPIRNQEMIDKGKPDLVIAFPGGRGTADMIVRAKTAGIEVIVVNS